MGAWRRVVAVWACFLARGLFYASMLPLWEGYDEFAHFAVVRAMVEKHVPLAARDQPLQRDVAESLRLAPVPWEVRSWVAGSLTEESWWQLPAEERRARQERLRALPHDWQREDAPGGLTAYEALQAPLYYWLMVPVLWVLRGAGLLTQVMALRWIAVAVASLTIPLVFLIGRELLGEAAAVSCAALVALMPGFLLDVARVANDCLAVVLFSALAWALVRRVKDRQRVPTLAVLLGFGLIAKAYFLTAVPVVWARLRSRCWPALAIAGWWYARNWITTHTLAGLSESVALRHFSLLEIVRAVPRVPWRTAVDSILLSHLYFGGWSSLTVRSWMYHLFYGVAAIGAIGVVWEARRLRWPLALYLCFWLGQIYNVLLLYLSKGLAGSMGWYLYAVVGTEVVLCTAGYGRFARWAAAGGAVLFSLLDLYTVHAVAIPYYTGMIAHKANGAIAALHAQAFGAVGFWGAFERLAANKPPLLSPSFLVVLWCAYVLATVALAALALRSASRPARATY